jgi:hypothetical protein
MLSTPAFLIMNLAILLIAFGLYELARADGATLSNAIALALLWLVVGFLQVIIAELRSMARKK